MSLRPLLRLRSVADGGRICAPYALLRAPSFGVVRRSAASGFVGYCSLPVLVSGTFSYSCLATIVSQLLEHPCTTVGVEVGVEKSMPHVKALIRGTMKFLALTQKVQTYDHSDICDSLDLIWSIEMTAVKR